MTSLLIAEDSPSQATMIQGLLESSGFATRVAVDGADALKQIEQEPPDLLITDLLMPNMNGCELTRAVVEKYTHIPVIVITARGSENLAVDALADGAVNFVPKSLLDTRLVPFIREAVELIRIDQTSADCGAELLVPELVFTLPSDLRAISPVIRYVQRTLTLAKALNLASRLRVTNAVSSAILNAICYGNLNMVDDEPGVQELILGKAPPETAEQVQLVVSVGTQDLRFSVSHDGLGRIARVSPAPGTPQSFELEDCRGLLLIASVMDQVHYDHARSEVILVKELK